MSAVQVNIPKRKPVGAKIRDVNVVESDDYNSLKNRPLINGVTLEGDLTPEDLGINNTVATIAETRQFLGMDN